MHISTELVAPNIASITKDVTVVQGEQGPGRAVLFCEVFGNPDPEITWFFYKDGIGKRTQVNKGGSHLNGNLDDCKSRRSGYFFLRGNDPKHLVICNPDFEEHQGKYKCHASNIAGKMDKYASVNIESKYIIDIILSITCDQAEFQHRSHILLHWSLDKIGPDTISQRTLCQRPNFVRRNLAI